MRSLFFASRICDDLMMSIHISASSFCRMKPRYHSHVGELCVVSVEVWRAAAAISSFRVQLWRNARVMRHLLLSARMPKVVVRTERALLLVLIQPASKARKRAVTRLFCDQPELSFEPSRRVSRLDRLRFVSATKASHVRPAQDGDAVFGQATLTCRLARCPNQTASCLVRLDTTLREKSTLMPSFACKHPVIGRAHQMHNYALILPHVKPSCAQ